MEKEQYVVLLSKQLAVCCISLAFSLTEHISLSPFFMRRYAVYQPFVIFQLQKSTNSWTGLCGDELTLHAIMSKNAPLLAFETSFRVQPRVKLIVLVGMI